MADQPVKKSRLTKVITIDSEGEKVSEISQQASEDTFAAAYQHTGIQEPPFNCEQLLKLSESHHTHGASLEQKSLDVVGTEWRWNKVDEEEKGETDENNDSLNEQRDTLNKWLMDLSGDAKNDMTSHDVLNSAWQDLETYGHGTIELARDPGGKLRYWFHLPGHSVRFHKDGVRCMQIVNEKRVWFKRWIPDDERVVDSVTGSLFKDKNSIPKDRQSRVKIANEIFVLKRPSRRASKYSVPNYITALGWITLSNAARDDNILFFNNRREPRWAIILENIDDDDGLEEQLLEALRTGLKEPHENLVLPLTGNAKVTFQQLGDNKGDMSWEKLQDRADGAILLSHRMPSERVGMVRSGPLGGNAVSATTRVYREGVVIPSQSLLSSRINALIKAESGVSEPRWLWLPTEFDLTEEEAEREGAVQIFQGGIAMLDEAREKVGLKPLFDEENEDEAKQDKRGKQFYWELSKAPPQTGLQPGAPPVDSQQYADMNNQLADRIEGLIGANDNVTAGEPAPAG